MPPSRGICLISTQADKASMQSVQPQPCRKLRLATEPPACKHRAVLCMLCCACVCVLFVLELGRQTWQSLTSDLLGLTHVLCTGWQHGLSQATKRPSAAVCQAFVLFCFFCRRHRQQLFQTGQSIRQRTRQLFYSFHNHAVLAVCHNGNQAETAVNTGCIQMGFLVSSAWQL